MAANSLTPSEIARETLRRLSVSRIPPTPDNYRQFYCEIAQEPSADAFPVRPLQKLLTQLPRHSRDQQHFCAEMQDAIEENSWELLGKALHKFAERKVPANRDWPQLIHRLVRQLELSHYQVSSEQKREALQTAYEAADGDHDRFYQQLRDLVHAWTESPSRPYQPTGEPVISASDGLSATTLCEHVELHEAIKKVLELLVRNIEYLAEDRWLHGQISAVLSLFTQPLSLELLSELQYRLQEVIAKQIQLKQQIGEAEQRLKTMLAGFIDHLADFSNTTLAYQDNLGDYAQKISGARSLSELSDVVGQMLSDTKTMRDNTAKSHTELQELRQCFDEANQRITELQQQLEAASTQVRLDPLTGTLNRKGMMEAFAVAIADAHSQQTPLSVSLLDIDNFKQINDTEGHQTGDQALIHLSRVIERNLRPADSLARYGGEEFLILLPNTRIDVAEEIITRLQRELTREFFMAEQRKLVITFSAGLTLTTSEDTPNTVLARADKALYQAKTSGKNKVVRI